MTTEPNPRRQLLGLSIGLVGMLAVGLAVFLPLFLWLPAPSLWRLLVWVAAFLGPLAGAYLGEWLAKRLGCPPRVPSLQQALIVVVLTLGLIATLPFLTRT